MASISLTRTIQAPRNAVFELFADIPGAAKNVSAIESIELLSEGPIGVGTRWRETRIMFGKEATEEMEITEFEPNDRYQVEASSCGCHYKTEILFEDDDAGTRVTMTFEARPASLFAYLFTPLSWLMKGTIRRAFAQDLDDLAGVLVEAAQAS